jgi:hypothetical protein
MTFGYLGRINVEKGEGALLDACARRPADANQLMPGYWLLFVFDAQGEPSMGRPVLVSSPAVAG